MNKFRLEDSNYSDLKTVSMSCDEPLGKHIKPPFENKSFFNLIAGSPGSGKTTFLFSMLINKGPNRIYYKTFKDIIYVSPKASQDDIDDNPLSDLPDDSIFKSLNYDVFDKISENKEKYDKIIENGGKRANQLLIIDDCSAFLKDKHIAQYLSDIANNRRHINLSIIIVVQYIMSIPSIVRSQASSIVMFSTTSNHELDVLKDEFINISKSKFDDLVEFVFRNKHDNLFVIRSGDMYKNLQKINMT
jgi:energy-coupling factor transporter ATP-binding protein EcfA2